MLTGVSDVACVGCAGADSEGEGAVAGGSGATGATGGTGAALAGARVFGSGLKPIVSLNLVSRSPGSAEPRSTIVIVLGSGQFSSAWFSPCS